jgi:hypothetical protein
MTDEHDYPTREPDLKLRAFNRDFNVWFTSSSTGCFYISGFTLKKVALYQIVSGCFMYKHHTQDFYTKDSVLPKEEVARFAYEIQFHSALSEDLSNQ